MKDLDQLLHSLLDFAAKTGIKLIIALILLALGWKLIQLLVRAMDKLEGFARIDLSAQGFIRSFVSIGLKIVLVIGLAGFLGLEMTSVLAVLASAGLAIGLALQGALGNLAGGLMILIFKPFRVGDYINNGSNAGTVFEINVFYTILKTTDNNRVMLPNGALTNASIINYSMEEKRRVDLEFLVDYASDQGQVRNLLLKIAEDNLLALQEPAQPFCQLTSYGDYGLVFTLRVWTLAGNYWPLRFQILEQVKDEFDRQGIVIPYAQLQVRLGQELD